MLALYQPLGVVVQITVFALGFLAVWMGAAAAHKTTGWRTLLLPIVVVLVYVVGAAIVALLLSGTEFTLQSVLADNGVQ